MACHDNSQTLAQCGEAYGPLPWRGPADGPSREVVVGVHEGGVGVWKLSAGVHRGHSMPGLIRSPSAKCWLSGCALKQRSSPGELLLLSTNFLAQWSWSNPSGTAHSDALCHSITQNVLLVSRHVREVTGKINLTLNFFSDVIIKKTNQMSEIK